MRTRPIIRNRRTEAVAGVALFLAGSLLLRDAYDQRGESVPWWARPFTWW